VRLAGGMALTDRSTRRFTDREVALVLRAATEIDESEGSGTGGGGIALDDLREIAREVGISGPAIERAVAELDRRGRAGASWAGAPLVHKAVRAVPGELDETDLARLIRIVDETTDGTGVISEALGSVRWTSSDRFRSTLVSLTPTSGETTVQVVEKAVPRLRRIFHLIPAAWGVMISTAVLASAGLGPAASVAAALGGMAAGGGLGRLSWTLLSARSRARVERMANTLSESARAAVSGAANDGDARAAPDSGHAREGAVPEIR
jgi:hypothetical protein